MFKPGDRIRYRKDVESQYREYIGLEGIFQKYKDNDIDSDALYLKMTQSYPSNDSLEYLTRQSWIASNFELCEPRKKLLVKDLLIKCLE